jgi:succinate dehydrogenase / fumarate reductase flavoprotein subunit/fumarate reductase flavoprotein subunit
VGFDLAREPVEVCPTAHYLMGGVKIDTACHSNLEGLFVAGEDSAGVHGANRLGGNGVACSTVFGGIAGDHMAAYVAGKALPEIDDAQVQAVIASVMVPFDRSRGEDVYNLRDELKTLMWEKAGLVRHAGDLETAQQGLARLRERAQQVTVGGSPRLNAEWHEWLNVGSLLTVSDLIVASALQRRESRGAHFRGDYPTADDSQYLQNIHLQRQVDGMRLWMEPVQFPRLRPSASSTLELERAYLAREGE